MGDRSRVNLIVLVVLVHGLYLRFALIYRYLVWNQLLLAFFMFLALLCHRNKNLMLCHHNYMLPLDKRPPFYFGIR